MLGIRPALGRLLTPADDLTPGAHAVAVVSHSFWRRRFGGDRSVVGSPFTFGEKRFEIVGVAQESFTGIEPGSLVDLWVPIAMYDANGFTFTNAEWNWLGIIGRLNPGVTRERARDVLQAPFTQFRRDLMAGRRGPDNPPDRIERYIHTPLMLESAANGPSGLRSQFARPLWILSILVGLVLLISVSNLANLSLARAAVREREMSVRLSVGATRSRLVQQMLIESALMAAVACALGLLFARLAGPSDYRAARTIHESRLSRVAYRLAIAGFPLHRRRAHDHALWTRTGPPCVRVAPIGALRGGDPRTTARTGLPRSLVAVQVSFSLAILFVAGLLLLSFGRLANTDIGFDKDGVLLVRVDSRERLDPEIARLAGVRLLERVRSVPGVVNASLCRGRCSAKVGRSPASASPDTSPTHSLRLTCRSLPVSLRRCAYASWRDGTFFRAMPH